MQFQTKQEYIEFLKRNKISGFSNNNSIIDIIDNIMQPRNSEKQKFNENVVIIVNNYKDENHKKGQVEFYLDIDEALLLSKDIMDGTFKNISYPGTKQTGTYAKYGGGKVSRVLSIAYNKEKNQYVIQASLYEPISMKNGAVLPDKNKHIDSHRIYMDEHDTRKLFAMLHAHIAAILPSLISEKQKG